MLRGLPSLQKLINQLRHIPYLASKNVYRVALHFLSASSPKVEQLWRAIEQARSNIQRCEICNNWAEGAARCIICADARRDMSTICVVEQWSDLYAIERAGEYDGVYHVLKGVLSPLEGIGPSDLAIDALSVRIRNGGVKEVIFATSQTPEGEATISFILSKLSDTSAVYSRLASGVPTGASLAYMDRTTIHRALIGRRPV